MIAVTAKLTIFGLDDGENKKNIIPIG